MGIGALAMDIIDLVVDSLGLLTALPDAVPVNVRVGCDFQHVLRWILLVVALARSVG